MREMRGRYLAKSFWSLIRRLFALIEGLGRRSGKIWLSFKAGNELRTLLIGTDLTATWKCLITPSLFQRDVSFRRSQKYSLTITIVCCSLTVMPQGTRWRRPVSTVYCNLLHLLTVNPKFRADLTMAPDAKRRKWVVPRSRGAYGGSCLNCQSLSFWNLIQTPHRFGDTSTVIIKVGPSQKPFHVHKTFLYDAVYPSNQISQTNQIKCLTNQIKSVPSSKQIDLCWFVKSVKLYV